MPEPIPTLVTVADLARAFDVSEATLRRIIRQYRITPTAYAAHVGVFDRNGIARVRHAVNAYQARKAEQQSESGAVR
jgi:transposase-like protein